MLKQKKAQITAKHSPHIVTYYRNLEYLQKVIICYLSHYPHFLKVSLKFIINYQVIWPKVKQTSIEINKATVRSSNIATVQKLTVIRPVAVDTEPKWETNISTRDHDASLQSSVSHSNESTP